MEIPKSVQDTAAGKGRESGNGHGNVVAREGASRSRARGNNSYSKRLNSGGLDSSFSRSRGKGGGMREAMQAFFKARGISRRHVTAMNAFLLLVIWTAASVIFAFTYNYEPPMVMRIPEDLALPDPVCQVGSNSSCLFAVGGGISLEGSFLPVIAGYDGKQWGTHELLPPGPNGYGAGCGTVVAALDDAIYAVGHSAYGDFYKFSRGSSDAYEWSMLSPLNLRRNGMAFTVYKGRIYAIGGKSYCYADPLQADEPSYLCQVAGWQLSGDNAASDRSTTMESIDPRTETEWTIECYNGGEEEGGIGDGGKCLTQERSGATAAEYGGRLFVIGGFHGTIVDVFDGVKFTELEEDFPNIVFGSSALFWRNKLWVTGGFAYNEFYADAITFDGKIWSKETQSLQVRAWHAAAVFGDRIFVLGGANSTSAIAGIESYDGNGWRVERDLPNAAGRLGAAAFAMN